MKKLQRTSIVYVGLSLFSILFERIYSIFSHGMSSDAMTYLFLYPLVLGSGVYGLINIIFPRVITSNYYRLFSNVYNTGIATLMTGLLLKGIFEIAGSSSGLLSLYFLVSYSLFGVAIIVFLRILICMERKED